MATSVAVAADLDSFAFVLSVGPEDSDDGVIAAVDGCAAQQPAAVVVDLARGGRRGPALLPAMSSRCARHAVPLLVAPLLAATMAFAGSAPSIPAVRAYPSVDGALASLPSARLPPSHRRTLSLVAEHTAPARARAAAAEAARAWGLDDLAFAIELVASELVSNAVVHAATPIDVVLRRDEQGLKIGVRDRLPLAPRAPSHAPADLAALGGRGLFLVSMTAKRWGCLVGSADKVIWAAIER